MLFVCLFFFSFLLFFFFFFKQKTAYEISACLVGSEMCIRDRYIYTHSRGYRLTLTMMLAGRDGRLFLSVVPGASHQYADIAGVDETMDWIRTLADQLTG